MFGFGSGKLNNKPIDSSGKRFVKEFFKGSFLILCVSVLGYTILVSRIEPPQSKEIRYIDLKNVISLDSNINESALSFLQNNSQKYILDKSVVVNSGFVPFLKWVQINQVDVLKKINMYYTLNYIENGIDNEYFKYNYDRITVSNTNRFQGGDANGIIVYFPTNNYIEKSATSYEFHNELGKKEIIANINNIDEINAINLLQTQTNDLYLICRNLSRTQDVLTFDDCKTEYSEALQVFKNIWQNINNAPFAVDVNARLFFEYYLLAMQNITSDSSCYINYGAYDFKNFYDNCSKDIIKSAIELNDQNISNKNKYLDYSKNISNSLMIKDEDLTPEMGFSAVGYKDMAVRNLLDKYAPMYSIEQLNMAKQIVNKYYDYKHPKGILELDGYSYEDIYNIKNADAIGKEKLRKNQELEKQQIEKRDREFKDKSI